MKKLVLVVAMFMFVCGGSFLVKAQCSAEAVAAPTEINATVVNDTVVKDTVTKEDAPAKASLVALAANVNDTVVTDTTSKDKPAEPVKEYPCQQHAGHSLPKNSKHTTKKAIPTFVYSGDGFFIILSSYNYSVGVLVSNIGSVFQLETIFAACASKLFAAKDTNVLV